MGRRVRTEQLRLPLDLGCTVPTPPVAGTDVPPEHANERQGNGRGDQDPHAVTQRRPP